jgi:hypothetical protein
MSYYKSHDGNKTDFWTIVIAAGLPILFAMLIGFIFSILFLQETKKDAESKYTVISSDGTKHSNLTRQFHNDSYFTTEQGKRIVFTGNHTTIEE